jgi:predicted nucleic acid-binding protein
LLARQDPPVIQELWQGSDERLSSSLLGIECTIAIRRTALFRGGSADDAWAREKLDLLSGVLDEVNFKAIDASIEEMIRLTAALADCRALDAIHMATALHFKAFVEGPLEIVTLDRRMRRVAEKLGFAVLPQE